MTYRKEEKPFLIHFAKLATTKEWQEVKEWVMLNTIHQGRESLKLNSTDEDFTLMHAQYKGRAFAMQNFVKVVEGAEKALEKASKKYKEEEKKKETVY